MPRAPRTDVQRAARYAAKVIPARVEDALDILLPDMQSGFGTWATHQAAIQSVVNGVLAGYSVPTPHYARYYAFAMQIDRARRKFGQTPAADAEIINAEQTWIGRGFNVVILDAVRSAVCAFDSYWTIVPTDYLSSLAVNPTNGQVVAAAALANSLSWFDPITHAETRIATLTNPASHLAWCPQLDMVVGVQLVGDVIFRIVRGAASPTEQPIDAADNPGETCVDYDPTKYGSTILGYAATVCTGTAKVKLIPLGGAISATTVVMPQICSHIVCDQANNAFYASAAAFAAVYRIDRTTLAVTTLAAAPHVGSHLILDPSHNEFWLAGGAGVSNVMRYNIGTPAWTDYASSDANPAIAVDTIRGVCYAHSPVAGFIDVINRDGSPITTIAVAATSNAPQVDPVGCFLIYSDATTGDVIRVHLLSLLSTTYALTTPTRDIAIDTASHKTYVSRYTPAGVKYLDCILP